MYLCPMARKGQKINLSEEDIKTLTAISRAHSADYRAVVISKIILMLLGA